MKTKPITSIVLSVVLSTAASIVPAEEEFPVFSDEDILCGFFGRPRFSDTKRLHNPKPEAVKVIEWLSETVGIEPNFKVYGAKMEEGSNIAAFAAIRSGTRYIVYNSDVLFTSPSNTVSLLDITVMGHEIGHHTSGVTAVGSTSPHAGELEADMVSGHMLRVIGASREQANAVRKYYPLNPTRTHPGRDDRINAILQGWDQTNKFLLRLP